MTVRQNKPARPTLLSKRVSPGTGQIVWTPLQDCTIKSVFFRFYVGCERDLELKPYIKHFNELIEPLLQYADPESQADDFVSGDDDKFEFGVGLPMYAKEKLIIDYENKAQIIADKDDGVRTLLIGLVIDYENGVARTDLATDITGV